MLTSTLRSSAMTDPHVVGAGRGPTAPSPERCRGDAAAVARDVAAHPQMLPRGRGRLTRQRHGPPRAHPAFREAEALRSPPAPLPHRDLRQLGTTCRCSPPQLTGHRARTQVTHQVSLSPRARGRVLTAPKICVQAIPAGDETPGYRLKEG